MRGPEVLTIPAQSDDNKRLDTNQEQSLKKKWEEARSGEIRTSPMNGVEER